MRNDDAPCTAPRLADPLAKVTAAMVDPCFELDTSEAAAVLSAFDTARERGREFDPFTVALVDVLRRQILNTDDGFEDEWDVEAFENDDPDDDLSDTEQYHRDTASPSFRGRRFPNRIPVGAAGANVANYFAGGRAVG